MNLSPVQQTAQDMETLYKATIDLYENYFKALEALINEVPESESEKLQALSQLVGEAEEALQADLAIFDKAISMDAEDIAGRKDDLQIQSIYDKLKK